MSRPITHGMSRLPEYKIWTAMKIRCSAKSGRYYHYYSSRGIKVCETWEASFEAFLNDMGRRPSAELSLERIDNDGNYEPDNCKWATRSQQNKNRRRSHPPKLIKAPKQTYANYQKEYFKSNPEVQKRGQEKYHLRLSLTYGCSYSKAAIIRRNEIVKRELVDIQ